MKTFEDIQKSIRNRRIKSILYFKGFNKKQKDLVDKYYKHLQRSGLRLESIKGYLQNLKLLLLDLGKDINKITRDDIDNYLNKIDQRYKPKTITERRKFLIIFFKWFFDKKKEDIDLIKDVIIKKTNGTKLPEEILTPEEIKKLVQVATNFRDKALVILLYETGARKGEFLKLKIKHIELVNKEYGMVNLPQGKTDSRKLPIIYSVPHLQNWINSHPNRDDPNSPLFITQGAWLGRAFGEDGLKRLLKILGKRAGIKKNLYPHLCRHARLTQLAKELTEQELKIFAGWCKDSNMASVYVHLSGSDVSNKLLANAGLIDVESTKDGKEVLKANLCPRCEEVNSADVKYCRCGFILDIVEMNKVLDRKNKTEQDLTNFIKYPEVQEMFKRLYKMEKRLEEIKK